MEHESDSNTSCNWCAQYSYQKTDTGTGGIGNKRTNGDHRNYSIIQISQNTKKSPGDLRKFSVIQTPVKKLSANARVKNSQMSKKNNAEID